MMMRAGIAKGGGTGTPQTTGDPAAHAAGFNATSWVARALTLANNNPISKIGCSLTSATMVTVKIVERTGAGSCDVKYSEAFSHGGGGWQDFTLTAPYTIPASGTFHAGYYPAGNPNVGYIAASSRAYAGGDIAGTGVTMTEDTGSMVAVRVNGP